MQADSYWYHKLICEIDMWNIVKFNMSISALKQQLYFP